MISITLPDGSKKEFEKNVTPLEVAQSISEGLARMAIAAKVNEELVDLTTTITDDATIAILTPKSEESLEILRHTTAHIFAQAVMRLYPKAKRTIGPAIEDGFFYDFDVQITDEDLPKIEEEMKKIVKEDLPISFSYKTKEEALKFYKGNEYKIEIINAIFDKKLNEEEQEEGSVEDGKLKFYKQGEYEDLCTGPHLPRTGLVKALKLDRVTKAYWRGDSKNKQLNRIYGTAFWKKSDLEQHFEFLEEAKKRDHRIIGKKMNLFTVSELVGSGLPLFKPNGMVLRKEVEDFLWDLHRVRGYKRVWTPHLAKVELYKTSGHYDHYKENFQVKGKEEDFMVKPMNCPHHMQMYADNYYSYKDLPVRYFEPATVYRDELSGTLTGISRVRAITQDDGHLFCRLDQIKEEVKVIVEIVQEFYKTFGMTEYWVSLSVRDSENKKDYLGSDEVWEASEGALQELADELKLPYKRIEGEAAFYGPKLDFMFKDCLGREQQLTTIQADFNLPERFELFYVNEKGEKERPVVIHRAIAGSSERFLSVMIEHFAGKFPFWLAPVQLKLLNIADRHIDYCEGLRKQFEGLGFRVETNYDHLTTSNKVRIAQEELVPYVIVLGDKDEEAKTVSVRNRENKTTTYKIEEFIKLITKEKEEKSLEQLA